MFLFIHIGAYSQGVTVTDTKLSADTNFNPIFKVTIKNSTDKAVTNVMFSLKFSIKDANPYDRFSTKFEDKNVEISISPKSSETTTMNITCPYIEDMKTEFTGYMITKVRFSDGSTESY